MKARPILMAGPMVKASLEGRKVQTRRVVAYGNSTVDGGRSKTLWNQLQWANPENFSDSSFSDNGMPWYLHVYHSNGDTRHRVRPIYEPGDLLWVRESFAYYGMKADQVFYRATDSGNLNWRPSIHMPRRYSRFTLELTGVRVERLQEISEEDAQAEGAKAAFYRTPTNEKNVSHCGHSYKLGFVRLWESIHGVDSWDNNPWIYALAFRVHHCNVDDLTKQITA